MEYILSLDQGTTSSRAILFDHAGSICAVAQREFEQIFPRPGWVEHDAMELWETQAHVANELLRGLDRKRDTVRAVGITNQRETTVVWDRATGSPIHHAIVWQDRRTAGVCDVLRKDGKAGLIQARTGLVLDAYFSGTKLQWILDHVDGARERAEAGSLAFGTVDSWLIWNLTGGAVHATDPSNASRTLLYNIHTGTWDDELLDLLRIPRSVLPEVRPSSGSFGTARFDTVGHEIVIGGVAGDQQAALFGQACTTPGMAKNTYGTGCFMLMNTGGTPVKSENNLLTTVAWQIGDHLEYALEGSVFVAGAVVQWLRDGLGIIESSADVEELARSVPDSGGVFLVPAFTGLGAPHWDAYARGTIVGLTRGSTRAHIARAALESIAFQTADVIHAMEADAGIPLKELRVDGGATANDLLMQIQAGLLGVPVIRPTILETTALGAAYLAGLAVSFWESQDDIATQWQIDKVFKPADGSFVAADRFRLWNRALERSKTWIETDES